MTLEHEDPWRDWKRDPIGNALAMVALLAYIAFVVALLIELFSPK